MIRTTLSLFLLAAVAVTALAWSGDAGRASLTWLGWRLDTTAAAAALIVLLGSLLATLAWRLAAWALEAPRRAARARAENRRRQGIDALTRGFVAVAAGDGSEARRLAQKAMDLSSDAPSLARILAAQAAEAAQDLTAARAAYAAMLGFPDLRLAGLRGLMQTALAEGDRDEALTHAQTAYGLAKTARWAWRALLDQRLDTADWPAALELVQGGLERKIIAPVVAERTRAGLLAASAAGLETSPNPKDHARALDLAQQSARLKSDFAPGVVMAARLLAADGKTAKAAALIEGAWKSAPHPALWLAYRDLKTDETPKARAARLNALAQLNPQHRESRILKVEQALIARDPTAARAATRLLDDEPATARFAGLMARVCAACGDADEARAWIVRGDAAPQEPDWSDLDPEGLAFAYTPQDWARLAATYGETGELIHPRLERRERTISDLPDLPRLNLSYAEASPFLHAAETGAGLMPTPDDPSPAPDVAAPPSARRAPTARRRLASAPRPAK